MLGALCDILDGSMARRAGRSSRRGAFLDSTLDRLAEIAVFIGLIACYFRAQLFVQLLTGLALTGSLMTSYARARAEGLGVDCKVGLLERPERLALLILGLLLAPLSLAGVGLLVWVIVLLALLTYVTTLQRILHVLGRSAALDAAPARSDGRGRPLAALRGNAMARKLPKRFPGGLFITLEGGEGSGKSTLLGRSGNSWNRKATTSLSRANRADRPSPRPCAASCSIRTTGPWMRSRSSFSTSPRAGRIWWSASFPSWPPAASSISDRFADASVAYQGGGRELGAGAGGTPEPGSDRRLRAAVDLLPGSRSRAGTRARARVTAADTSGGDRIERESLAFHERVRAAYHDWPRATPARASDRRDAAAGDGGSGGPVRPAASCGSGGKLKRSRLLPSARCEGYVSGTSR